VTPGPPDNRSPSLGRQLFTWGERLLIGALLIFATVRLGPQLGALLGVGPDLGSSPTYTFTALDGTLVHSDALRGEVVVLNFWATWCGPCKLEMPSLQSLHEDRADDGVVVLGLATDVGSGTAVTDFVADRGITYPIGRATRAHRSAFGGIVGIPTTYLIDRNGIVRHKVVGYFAPPALRVAVDRLLKEEAADSLAPSAGRAFAR
jgi:thiol-disulfide isomerase/thioredoxin